MAPPTAANCQLVSCRHCLRLAGAGQRECPRCGEHLHARKKDSVQTTVALLLTAIILYVPANVLPIMITEQLGRADANTILGGVVVLIELGEWPIAAVIFVASVMVPMGKIIALSYLSWSVRYGAARHPHQRTVIYRVTEFVGKWSMIDVFVVAVLVALVHQRGVLAVYPGAAALAFAAVVVITMVAAESFDPRLIWDRLEQ